MNLAESLLLFDAPEKKEPDKGSISYSAFDEYRDDSFVIGKRMSKCIDVLGPIKQDECKHVVSMGEWSADNVIAWSISQINEPVDLVFASWSISPEPARRLGALHKNGLIKSIKAVFDLRAVIRKPEAIKTLKAAYGSKSIKIFNNHAKCYVVTGQSLEIAIVTSANLTNNPRVETYCIYTNKEVVSFHKNWILKTFNDGDPFSEDVFEKSKA